MRRIVVRDIRGGLVSGRFHQVETVAMAVVLGTLYEQRVLTAGWRRRRQRPDSAERWGRTRRVRVGVDVYAEEIAQRRARAMAGTS